VAYGLDKCLGLVSYHHIFHTDNRKEFIEKLLVNLLKTNNPHCFVVTGWPRTPHDQRSVESSNKLVQQIMKSISSKQQQASLEDNWIKFLGQIIG
jgi:hypothetical protein